MPNESKTQLKPRISRMITDDQSNTNPPDFTPQVTRERPPELFLCGLSRNDSEDLPRNTRITRKPEEKRHDDASEIPSPSDEWIWVLVSFILKGAFETRRPRRAQRKNLVRFTRRLFTRQVSPSLSVFPLFLLRVLRALRVSTAEFRFIISVFRGHFYFLLPGYGSVLTSVHSVSNRVFRMNS